MAMVLTRLYTAEDLEKLATDEEDFELIEGVLVPRALAGFDHAVLHANVLFLLHRSVSQLGSGKVVGRAGYILRRDPDTVLAPCAAFIAEERLPEDTSSFPELAPDLSVEIVPPGNLPGEIERKIAIYLQSGVRAIWVVYPNERQVVVHTPDHAPKVFGDGDHIDGGDVLPGLSLPVAEIFA
jgi:Uma2 family endonuclease